MVAKSGVVGPLALARFHRNSQPMLTLYVAPAGDIKSSFDKSVKPHPAVGFGEFGLQDVVL